MLFCRALSRPRDEIETRDLSYEEFAAKLRSLFMSGGDIGYGIHSAEQLSPVAAAHRILTNSFALVPMALYEKDGDARKPVSDKWLDRVLKERPNQNMSPFLCAKTLMSNAFWHGVGYIWNRRDEYGRVVARIPLPSECCSVRRDHETGNYWYDFSVDGAFRSFASYELSILYFETYDGIHGRGMLQLARETIGTDAMAQRYNKKFYQNGSRLSGIVEIDTDAESDTRQKVKKEFLSYASDDAFSVAVLDHGMKYTPLGISQADAQYIESRQFSVEEVSRITGIPKYMLQVGKEAYNSNAQQRIDYVTDTLLPYVTHWEQENTYKLLTPSQRDSGMYIKGNVGVLLRADPKTRADFFEKMIQNSVYCPDECRAMEERNPIPDGLGKRFLVTKNLGALESVLKGGESDA